MSSQNDALGSARAQQVATLWALGGPACEADWVTQEQLDNYLQGSHPSDTETLPVVQYAGDLYLACACALGTDAAIALFESRHETDMDRALHRMALSRTLKEDIKQTVRAKLFAGDHLSASTPTPAISKYAGRGHLAGWVRAVVVRTAIDMLRKEKSDEILVDQQLLEKFSNDDFPDLQALKATYRHLANEAFETGFAALDSRQRNLLRQHYIHHLNIDQLGTMYKIHRTTAFRWIAQARAAVLSEARSHVCASLGEAHVDAGDLLKLLESQIDISINRLLQTKSK